MLGYQLTRKTPQVTPLETGPLAIPANNSVSYSPVVLYEYFKTLFALKCMSGRIDNFNYDQVLKW